MSNFIELREIEGRGTAIFANEDLFPGQLILAEEPLLFVDVSDIKPFCKMFDPDLAAVVGTWSKFLKQPVERQERFLNLYGPTHGQADQAFALTFKDHFVTLCAWQGVPFSEELFSKFLRVFSIYKYNTLGLNDEDRAVYETATRTSRSCLPNVSRYFRGKVIELRVVLPVKKGEELTLEYNPHYRNKPTHFRRFRYLLTKEFTCHCSRCDTLGDDTRQFSCCKAKCEGYHLVCQPINQTPLAIEGGPVLTDLHYTGVEYVEPYLLPCDVCSRAASAQYQAEMFAFEARMPEISKQLNAEYYEDFNKQTEQKGLSYHRLKAFMQRVEAAKFPVKHALSEEVMALRMKLGADCLTLSQSFTPLQKDECMNYSVKVTKDLLAHQISTIGGLPSTDVAFAYLAAAYSFVFLDVSEALKHMQKAVQTATLALGRSHPDVVKTYDTPLADLMDRIMTGQAMSYFSRKFSLRFGGLIGSCLFCGQSCEGTAFSLMKCSKCKNAEYCSRECQKLHWKFHKMSCGKMPDAQWHTLV